MALLWMRLKDLAAFVSMATMACPIRRDLPRHGMTPRLVRHICYAPTAT